MTTLTVLPWLTDRKCPHSSSPSPDPSSSARTPPASRAPSLRRTASLWSCWSGEPLAGMSGYSVSLSVISLGTQSPASRSSRSAFIFARSLYLQQKSRCRKSDKIYFLIPHNLCKMLKAKSKNSATLCNCDVISYLNKF